MKITAILCYHFIVPQYPFLFLPNKCSAFHVIYFRKIILLSSQGVEKKHFPASIHVCRDREEAFPAKLTVRHGRKAAATAPYVDNRRVKLSPWPRYRLVRGEADWRGNIKRGIILKYGQIKTAGYDPRDVPVVRSGYASTLQTTDLHQPMPAHSIRGRDHEAADDEN